MASIPRVPIGSSTLPVLGFGTAVFPFVASETMKESILHAIKLGYRHIDAASVYNSEQPLGEAITEALGLGLIKSREELFITSKLWCTDAHPHLVLPALHKTLKNLGLEYLDLYLVHFPVSLKPGSYAVPFDKTELLPMDFKSVWEAMEVCHSLGLARSIGVSNFSCKKLQDLLATAKIPPAVNQAWACLGEEPELGPIPTRLLAKVEMSPLWQQKKLREFCKGKNILVTAYSPLGARGTQWGTNEVLDSKILQEIAQAKGKTVAQICLRWVLEQGVSVVVKSFNKKRIKENIEILDWELSPEESQKIEQIEQQRGFPGHMFVWEEGPYKSVEEFWDGEI